MVLPTTVIKAVENANPKLLIIFGKPKSGKTTLMAALEDNLIIDFEKGTNYVDALKVSIESMKDISELIAALKEKKGDNEYAYKFGTLDTATAMEDMVSSLAVSMYKKTPMGASFTGNDVTILPNGAGYKYTREAFTHVLNLFKPYFKHMILLGHTKDKMINVQGKELSQNSLDLTGKLERIVAADADGLGYLYRKKNQTIINFNGGDDFVVEARPAHLRGKEIVVMESDADGKITHFLDRLFI